MLKRIKGWIKLLSIKGIGRGTAIKLVKTLGEPYKFLYENPDLLKDISLPGIKELTDGKSPENWENIESVIKKLNINFVSILDENYPELLKQIYEPPPFLFYLGNLDKKYFQRVIAVVGTRKPTAYGRMMTNKITSLLVEKNFTIVSGLAYGIDTIAHKTAVENKGYTIAVLGTPIDNIYPPGNRKLAEKIMENGAIISEIIPTRKTDKWSFPKRNRIISGLSYGTIVIEGSKKSGSLITARHALDQNRDIFALPGDVNKIQAEGPNYLIKNGAQIITKPRDILEFYDLLSYNNEEQFQIQKLTKEEENIYQMIKLSDKELTFDAILIKSQISYAKLSAIILSLELKNAIKKTAGNRYIANF